MDEFINQRARKKVRTMCTASKKSNKITEIRILNGAATFSLIAVILGMFAISFCFNFASEIKSSVYYYWSSDYRSSHTFFVVLGWLCVFCEAINFIELMTFRRALKIVKICPNCGCIYLPEDFVCSFCGADVRTFNANDNVNQYAAAQVQPTGGRMCPKCRTINQEDSRFCQACGFDFSTVEINSDQKKCSVCGSDMPADSLFCPNCGNRQEIA